jgi:hypothetical protein
MTERIALFHSAGGVYYIFILLYLVLNAVDLERLFRSIELLTISYHQSMDYTCSRYS